MKKLTFTKACLEFFGKLPGQSLMDFGEELKALTVKDRKELSEMFLDVDIEIIKK
jgi:hypothetical protein